MRETRSSEPLERDKRGRRILKHDRGGYSRGCGCETCTADHTAEMRERRGPRRSRVPAEDVYGGGGAAALSARIQAAVDQVRGETTRAAWTREAVVMRLEAEGVEITDDARRPAPRRRNYRERQQREEGKQS